MTSVMCLDERDKLKLSDIKTRYFATAGTGW